VCFCRVCLCVCVHMPMHAHVREGKGVHAWSGEDVEAAKLQGEGVQNVIKLKILMIIQ